MPVNYLMDYLLKIAFSVTFLAFVQLFSCNDECKRRKEEIEKHLYNSLNVSHIAVLLLRNTFYRRFFTADSATGQKYYVQNLKI